MASMFQKSLRFELILGLFLLIFHSSLSVQPVEDNEFEEFDGPKQPQAQPSPASKPHSEPLPASGKPNAIKEQEWDDEDEKEFGTARPLSPSPGHADAGRTPEPSKAEAAPAPIPAHEPAPAADSEFDEEPVAQPAAKPAPASPPPAQEASQQKPPVRDFDEEAYEEQLNSEEFENFDDDSVNAKRSKSASSKIVNQPSLNIVKVAIPMQSGAQGYWAEIILITGLVVYVMNLVLGKTKNSRIVRWWAAANWRLLEREFALVGDDGKQKELPIDDEAGGSSASGSRSGASSPNGDGELDAADEEAEPDPDSLPAGLLKESESVYRVWCSGRVRVESLVVELRLLKRHDLFSLCSYLVKPQDDQIIYRVTLDDDQMETFVVAACNKRSTAKLQKDYNDLSFFTPDKKSGANYGLPNSFHVLSEIGDITSDVFDEKVIRIFEKHESRIEYIHFSDQYSGIKKSTDETSTKLPELKKVLTFCFNVGTRGRVNRRDLIDPELLRFVFYCVDHVCSIRLSRESASRAEKNRAEARQETERALHAARQEAAQTRKEEKRKKDRERLYEEDDPNRARRMEEKLEKEDGKKSKGMKVKAMKVKG